MVETAAQAGDNPDHTIHQATPPALPHMRQHIVLLQAMLQQDRFAAPRNPVQELASSFSQLETVLADQTQTQEAIMAVCPHHPHDAYRTSLMQRLQQQQQQLLA